MRLARIGPHEDQRLAALADHALAEGSPDAELTHLTDLACRLFDVPIALVTLVDERRAVFGGRTGIEAYGADREISFCAHALAEDDLLVIPDTRLDPRFADNPLVAGADPLLFYAGVPLRTQAGHILGTLCVIDRRPRAGLPARDRRTLRDLGMLAIQRLEARRLAAAHAIGQQRFRQAAAASPDAIACGGEDGIVRFWNPAAERLFGHGPADAVGRPFDLFVPGPAAPADDAGEPAVLAARHRDGRALSIEMTLWSWREDGKTGFVAVMRDGARRRAAAARLLRRAARDRLSPEDRPAGIGPAPAESA